MVDPDELLKDIQENADHYRLIRLAKKSLYDLEARAEYQKLLDIAIADDDDSETGYQYFYLMFVLASVGGRVWRKQAKKFAKRLKEHGL